MDVYMRILARFDASQLQHHCSAVVDEELRHVRAELDEVFAAYARLQEVREAVASLEASQPYVRRSANVMTMVESTDDVQQNLLQRIHVMYTAMRAVRAVKTDPSEAVSETVATESVKTMEAPAPKRKRSEEAAVDVTEEKSMAQALQKKPKMPERIKNEGNDDGETSATESEDDEPLPHAGRTTLPVAPRWVHQVHEAGKHAQRLFSTKSPPTIDDVASLVSSVADILVNIPAFHGDYRKLANSQFNNLISLTVRVLDSNQRNASFASFADRVLRSLSDAIARNRALNGLSKFYDELTQIKQSHHKHESRPPLASGSSTFNAVKWTQGVNNLRSQLGGIVKQNGVVPLTKLTWIVGCVCEMLDKARTAPATDTKTVTSQTFHGVVRCTTELFSHRHIDTSYLPLLNRTLTAMEKASETQERFQSLQLYLHELKAVRTRLENSRSVRHVPALSVSNERAPVVASPAGSVVARFESLVNAADELLAVPVSERSGRVSNFVFLLQKELQATFPTKGKRTTPSRGALSAASDAIRKAVELMQHDISDSQQNHTFYKSFLELLFSIGAKYNTIKLLISKSKDDLHQYLYPQAKPLSKPKPKAVPTAQPPPAVAATDEAALWQQLSTVYRRIQSWHDDVFSLKEFDEVMRVVRSVMGHHSTQWRVKRDRTLAECLELLAIRAQAIKKKEHRDGRVASVTQWQAQMECWDQNRLAMDLFARIVARLDAPQLQRHCSDVLDEELRHRLQEMREAVASVNGGQCDALHITGVMEVVEAAAAIHKTLAQHVAVMQRSYPGMATMLAAARTSNTGEYAALGSIVVLDETRRSPQSHMKRNATGTPARVVRLPFRPSAYEHWEDRVLAAIKVAQRLDAATNPPEVREVARLVGSLEEIPASVPNTHDDLRQLSMGDFSSLVVCTVRVLTKEPRNAAFVPLAKRLRHTMHNAMARSLALSGLDVYLDKLDEMTRDLPRLETPAAVQSEPETRSPRVVFDVDNWTHGMECVGSHLRELERSNRALAQDQVDWIVRCVCRLVQEATAVGSDVVTSWRLFTVLMSTTHLFGRPEITPANLPLLDKLLSMVETARAQTQEHFQDIDLCAEDLKLFQRPPNEVVLHEQLLTALKRVQSWHNDSLTLRAFDEIVGVLRGVINCKSSTWRRDSTVATCLAAPARCTQGIHKKPLRDERLATIQQCRGNWNHLLIPETSWSDMGTRSSLGAQLPDPNDVTTTASRVC